ncbi:amidohydrolase [Arthrobacter sp. A2-55]|uniref:amidohydrolase n=1 Tax=Arthrobacter sp. A2-55 TaxID=2897337 RepID=UPI0021CD8901|nr:amidohydrolase [Arthrobacter sp. A2-55]MCU6481161.1 amidohydrolase [Arthrobacter sp. A2-55]
MVAILAADAIHVSFVPHRQVQALVIDGEKVVFAGTSEEAHLRYPQADQSLELNGTIIPGLVDSHVHTVFTGMTGQWANLRPEAVGSMDALIAALVRCGASQGWYRGWGYDDTLLLEGRHPSRHDLDRVSVGDPVLVTHLSGHFAVANTRALELAGVWDGTPDPVGGNFVRDEAGRASGLLWGIGAVRAVREQCPQPERGDGLRAAREAMDQAVSQGITQIHDMAIGSQFAARELDMLREIADAGAMPVRLFGYLIGDLVPEIVARDPELFRHSTASRLQIRGAKLWADGSIQGLSAAVVDGYECCPESHGNLLLSSAQIVAKAQSLLAAGAQLAVHANGDGAIGEVIEAFRELRGLAAGEGWAKHRIEHFQMAHPEDIKAAAEVGLGASLFTNHVHYWGDRHRDRFVGPARAERMNPLRECLDHGLTVGMHSDSPVTPMNILATIETAVTRSTLGGSILGAAQGVSAAEAFHVATALSADLVGMGGAAGTLEPGMLADLVLLDRDPLLAGDAPGHISASVVKATMVGGEWVYGA